MANIVIIGGGAAGMMAAIAAARTANAEDTSNIENINIKKKHNITIIEKNEKLGKKLFITGKGRCNLTNACNVADLFNNVMEHSKFLYSSIYGFDNQSVMHFFEEAGCLLKIERGQRVFPQSDHSSDVIKVLEKELQKLGVQVQCNSEVQKINVRRLEDDKKTTIENDEDACKDKKKKTKNQGKLKQNLQITTIEIYNKVLKKKKTLYVDSLIVATGGCSYVLTGSTGDGYRFARDCGHRIVSVSPALVPFSIKEDWCYMLQGLSLKNVQASLEADGRQIYSGFGEMLFTHYGVSGPLMLSASSYYAHKACKGAKLFIDLKPALNSEQLDKRILREFDENKNKQFRNAISSLFPAKLIQIMPALAGIDPDKKVNEVTKEERLRFLETIKHMELTVTGLRDYDEAIITKGGVATDEISPSTMESKLVKGLYFAGEVIDVDALTGGFNLQIAWSTGYLAGKSAVLA